MKSARTRPGRNARPTMLAQMVEARVRTAQPPCMGKPKAEPNPRLPARRVAPRRFAPILRSHSQNCQSQVPRGGSSFEELKNCRFSLLGSALPVVPVQVAGFSHPFPAGIKGSPRKRLQTLGPQTLGRPDIPEVV